MALFDDLTFTWFDWQGRAGGNMILQPVGDETADFEPERQSPVRKSGSLAVLQDLFELLEAYGPTWYTEELRDRAVAAILGQGH